MRCENCGWDNPDGNVKCEKCNAPLGKSSGQQGATLRSPTQGSTPNGFDPKKTQQGCPGCGYPLRPDDSRCPNCDRLRGNAPAGNPAQKNEPEPNQRPQPNFDFKKTVRPGEKNNEPQTGGKLVGFLVTYSHDPLGEFFPVYEGKNTIGRNATNSIRIKDDSISGEHLTIAYYSVDNKFYFEPELSTNGTYINSVFYPFRGELKDLDIIRIGSTQLVFMVIPPMV